MTTTDTNRAFERLRTGDWLISPSVVAVGAPGRAAADTILVRDPDGHAVKVVQR